MADALTAAASILDAGWTFISGNPVLFGMCCTGLISGAVYTVKSFF
ncbi:hypothetical protein [Clostridium butyricum]|nr:hypothetical protein [Clostridium butyricum]